jgi:hypothetical protein
MRMALITIDTVPDVTRVTAVFRISCGLRVAERALEYRVVRGIRMACSAHAGGPAVSQREKVMRECCAGPGSRVVAVGAIPRSKRGPGSSVVRIRCGVVDTGVAAVASQWQRREIVIHMAIRAGNRSGMKSRQRESRGVVIEGGRLPNGSRMAERAVGWETDLRVVRSRGGLILR